MTIRDVIAGAAMIVTFASTVSAQQADVIRGRVVGEDGKAVENASVQATSIPGNVARAATTDRSGRYTITYAAGEGDYWITVTALGFAPKKFELKRVADEDVLVGDAKLSPVGAVLGAVRVQADRARVSRADNTDVSGTDRSVANTAVDPAQAGSLAALAASQPGVQLIPGADGNPDQFSVFGLGGDQSSTTLNGLGFGGGEIPRDAATRTSLATSPWDVSRGGFAGAQLGVRTQPGSNFSTRSLSTLVNSPAVQWTDRAGRSTGAEYSTLSVGAATSGPVSLNRSFYSIGYQLDRKSSDLQSLLGADAYALQTAGLASDSVRRVLDALTRTGIPRTVPSVPSARVNQRGMVLASFDFAPPTSTSGQSLNVTAMGSFNSLAAPFGSATTLPTADGRLRSSFFTLQGRHTSYFGFGVLTETSAGISRMSSGTDPYAVAPTGSVRVTSTLSDGSNAISRVTFGGNSMQSTSNENVTAAAQNQLSWFSVDNKHRIRLSSELRYERAEQDLTTNPLGTFAYNSLADLDVGRPSMFVRTLGRRSRTTDQVAGSISLGDSYRPRPDLQIQYGVRLDANRFLSEPARNPALQSLSADNTRVPDRLYASPRVGFSWTYGAAPQLAIASGFTRGPRAVVRGGVGVFQSVPGSQLVGAAMTGTGLATGTTQLVCVGTAVPSTAWTSYLNDPASIPDRCADGTTGSTFASAAPDVALFDESFAASRSLRADLNWTGLTLGNRLAAAIDGTLSLNRDQAGAFDLNFAGIPRFSLGAESGRPVFVDASSVVQNTGAVTSRGSRIDPAFGLVMAQRSDLSSVNRQLTITLRPAAFSSTYTWAIAYVYSNTRDVLRGFANTAGDPRLTEPARSTFDARHQIQYSLSYNIRDWVPVSITGSVRSGRPFTPMVAGDVNGDGFSNDRAFVFDPDQAGLDPAFASAMRALLNDGAREARSCLSSQLGTLAGRSSCEGPWTVTSNAMIAVNPVKLHLPQRLNVSLYVNNLLGAADLLLNGEGNRRGWGQSVVPDQTLLFVRGFDATTRRFRYDVNPRFGATSLAQTLNRNPVVVTAQARVDIGFARERQLLTQSLDRGRTAGGARSTDQDLRSMGGALIPANPMYLILQQTDSLQLTRRQADSLSTLNRAYAIAFDSIWTPVAKYLASLPKEYDRAEAYARYRRAREASVDALSALVPSIRSLLTPAQMRRLPAFITTSLDTRYLASVRSSTAGGANMGILGMLAQMGWSGGMVDASGGTQTVMIHR